MTLEYPSGSGPLCSNERKKKYIIGGVIGAIVLIIIIIIICVTTGSSDKPGNYVLTQVPLVDGYNNLAQLLRIGSKNNLDDLKFDTDLSMDTKWGNKGQYPLFTDLVRMRKGQLFGQVWYAAAPCDAQYKDATNIVLEQIDLLKRLFKSYPNDLQHVSTSGGLLDTYKKGAISNFIGVSGGHALDSRLAVLRMFYDLGVRFLTLLPCDNAPWVEKDDKNVTIKLRDFGEQIVGEANRLGIVLDLMGLNDTMIMKVLEKSYAPVIFSHTASAKLVANNANLNDSVIKAIKENKGLIMVTFDPDQLGDPKNMTQLLDHIDYIASVGSVDIVGLGSGFGLYPKPILGINGTTSYPDIFDALKQYKSKNKIDWSSMDNLKKIASDNFLRVLMDVERIRDAKISEKPLSSWINMDYLKNITDLQNCQTNPPLPSVGPTTTPPTEPTTETTIEPSTTTNKPTTKHSKQYILDHIMPDELLVYNADKLNPKIPIKFNETLA